MFWTKKKKEEAKPAEVAGAVSSSMVLAPASSAQKPLRYDPELIRQLQMDHAHLLRLFGQLQNAVQSDQWSSAVQTLAQFRVALIDHLLSEGVKLYAYGNQAAKADPLVLATFKEFKTEMSQIGSVVFDFIDKFAKTEALTDSTAKLEFAQTLGAIGEALVSRIQREERVLYPLYDDLPNL